VGVSPLRLVPPRAHPPGGILRFMTFTGRDDRVVPVTAAVRPARPEQQRGSPVDRAEPPGGRLPRGQAQGDAAAGRGRRSVVSDPDRYRSLLPVAARPAIAAMISGGSTGLARWT
jgi:hypothetical protein